MAMKEQAISTTTSDKPPQPGGGSDRPQHQAHHTAATTTTTSTTAEQSTAAGGGATAAAADDQLGRSDVFAQVRNGHVQVRMGGPARFAILASHQRLLSPKEGGEDGGGTSAVMKQMRRHHTVHTVAKDRGVGQQQQDQHDAQGGCVVCCQAGY